MSCVSARLSLKGVLENVIFHELLHAKSVQRIAFFWDRWTKLPSVVLAGFCLCHTRTQRAYWNNKFRAQHECSTSAPSPTADLCPCCGVLWPARRLYQAVRTRNGLIQGPKGHCPVSRCFDHEAYRLLSLGHVGWGWWELQSKTCGGLQAPYVLD